MIIPLVPEEPAAEVVLEETALVTVPAVMAAAEAVVEPEVL